MIYIICSEEEFENIIDIIDKDYVPCLFIGTHCQAYCGKCIRENIKRINTDITPDTPNYSTEAENKAFLQGFNVAVKKMRGDVEE